MEEFNKRNERKNSKSREGANGIEETKKEDHKEEAKQTREARQGNSNKEEARTEEAGTERRTAKEEQKEFPRVVSIDEEQPEQFILEVKESKRKKKTKKKTANKVKDEIKLALVSVYALAGATLDECFYLKPNEADLLAEAIYRYLDEHNLIHTISEKSATFNLIVALVSVNLPKFTEYYKNLKSKKGRQQNNDQEREAKVNSGQSIDRVPGGQPDSDNAKAYLTEFYSPDER